MIPSFLAQIFRDGMIREMRMPRQWVNKMFPRLDDLVLVHDNFLAQLQALQGAHPDRHIDEIGAALVDQVRPYWWLDRTP